MTKTKSTPGQSIIESARQALAFATGEKTYGCQVHVPDDLALRRQAPTAYDRLLCEVRPEVIETQKRYDDVSLRLAELVGKGRRRTASETRLMRLLAVLVEDYDRRHARAFHHRQQ